MPSNTKQIAGTHYMTPQGGVQLWDYLIAIDSPFLEGNAAKYIFRWRKKGGIQDLYKARHYIEKRIEHDKQIESTDQRCVTFNPELFDRLILDNKMHADDILIIACILHWRVIDALFLAITKIDTMIAAEQSINASALLDAYELTDKQSYLGEIQ